MTKIISDTPFQLDKESLLLDVSLKPGVPTLGQATIEWTLPPSVDGCDGDSEYCGIVVLLSNSPVGTKNIPQNGIRYVSDPTGNHSLHVGDKIGDALVIGAFYEGEKKARGENLTTSFVISDFDNNSAVYVAAYPVDCQLRYFSDGIRAYSDKFGEDKKNDYPSYQLVNLNNGQGALPTDGTNLMLGLTYSFELHYTENYPSSGSIYKIDVDTNNAQTYEELIDNINQQIAFALNPLMSPSPLYQGTYYYKNNVLKQWNGSGYDNIEFINEFNDPSIVSQDQYWFDGNNLYIYDSLSWIQKDFVPLTSDPTNISSCETLWYNGTKAYKFNGTNWCELITYNTILDPSCVPILDCNSYWYNTEEEVLNVFKYDKWEQVESFYWPEAPNNLSIGTYWFNIITDQLFLWNGLNWDEITNFLTLDNEPTTNLVNGALWYDPTTQMLYEYDDTTPEWVEQTLLLWNDDPTILESCTLWWNSDTDELFTWNSVSLSWDSTTFISQANNPLLPPIIFPESAWYNTDTNELFIWDGVDWFKKDYIHYPTQPNIPTIGYVWFDVNENKWFEWDGSIWVEFDPIDSSNDPTNLPQNVLWYDKTNDELKQLIGASWVSISFVTSPINIPLGTLWYDTNNDILYEWNNQWIKYTLPFTVYLNNKKQLQFTTNKTGSSIGLSLLVPNSGNEMSGFANFAVGDIQGYSPFDIDFKNVIETSVEPEQFLFNFLIGSQVGATIIGSDEVSDVPSYIQLGVGTDGTPDERRALHTSIKEQLGYPVVNVELTASQLDTTIRKALDVFRQRSSLAYKRGFYFLDIAPRQQRYLMTNRQVGFHKIVNIMAAYRFNSAFLSSTQAGGVFGQATIQHLYTMGTYDLTSFHLMAQYIETLEDMFATKLTFQFNEYSRMLDFYHTFTHPERVLLDCMVEKTEQELLVDRISKHWLEQYALAEAMIILANIRGKFSTLPGAGGGITLNANELMSTAENMKISLMEQIEDYIVQDPENVGMNSTFIIG